MAKNLTLHMGFLPVPYTKKYMADPWRGVRSVLAKKQSRGADSKMTAKDVADILEDKYNIIEVFAQLYEDEIMEPMINKFHDIVLKTLSGEYKSSTDKIIQNMRPKTREIESLFRNFLSMEEMNGRTGIPTEAARTGKGRRTRRSGPSFVDTGIYRAAFRAWIA
jgi:hypothetical protein